MGPCDSWSKAKEFAFLPNPGFTDLSAAAVKKNTFNGLLA